MHAELIYDTCVEEPIRPSGWVREVEAFGPAVSDKLADVHRMAAASGDTWPEVLLVEVSMGKYHPPVLTSLTGAGMSGR